ncbi:MAG: NAD-dependent epimerase/dehydratase family protein [Gemmatimonadales bacterium]
MRALVTGGTGFVGSHLIDAVLQAGDSVTALVRSPAKAGPLRDRGVRLVAGDLGDKEALRAAARDQDIVYHCAGLVKARSKSDFFAVNRDGTARVLGAAAEGSPRARFVYVSSLSAAGPSGRGERRSDHEPPAPASGYGRSKLAGEQVVQAGPLPWTILRPPGVYGPRDTEFLRVFRAARYGILPVFGDGGQELSLVHATDLARALLAAGRSQATIGGVFYPCHPAVVTSAGLARAVAKAMERERVRLVHLPRWLAHGLFGLTATAAQLAGATTLLTPDKAAELFAPAWTADPGPLEAASGWRAEYDLVRGLGDTAAWYRQAGWL